MADETSYSAGFETASGGSLFGTPNSYHGTVFSLFQNGLPMLPIGIIFETPRAAISYGYRSATDQQAITQAFSPSIV